MADNVEEKKPVKRVACEVYSRIVGYLRPVQDWNRGKQQEFAERKTYAVPALLQRDGVPAPHRTRDGVPESVPPSDKSD